MRHQDIRHKVIWRDGKRNPADYLSRYGRKLEKLPRDIQQEAGEFGKLRWFLHSSPYMEAITIERIQKHTGNCPELSNLKSYILKGQKPGKDDKLRQFRKVIQELTVSDGGLILRGEIIVLPASLIKLAISRAHQGGHSRRDKSQTSVT